MAQPILVQCLPAAGCKCGKSPGSAVLEPGRADHETHFAEGCFHDASPLTQAFNHAHFPNESSKPKWFLLALLIPDMTYLTFISHYSQFPFSPDAMQNPSLSHEHTVPIPTDYLLTAGTRQVFSENPPCAKA